MASLGKEKEEPLWAMKTNSLFGQRRRKASLGNEDE
jgi:hypothetical protein